MYKLKSYLTHMYSMGYTSHVLYGVNEHKQKQSLMIVIYIIFDMFNIWYLQGS